MRTFELEETLSLSLLQQCNNVIIKITSDVSSGSVSRLLSVYKRKPFFIREDAMEEFIKVMDKVIEYKMKDEQFYNKATETSKIQ